MTIKKWLARGLLAFILLVLLYQLWIFLHVCWWISHNPSSTALMDDRLAVLREDNPSAKLKHKWVDYKKISTHLKRAVIASEDAKFNEHAGFDWDGIQKAYEKNIKKGKIVAGGSTIRLEKMMSKQRILEIYLNVIEWGNGVFGAEAAARHYYGVSARGLSSYQAARMAAMIPNPRYYDKHRSTRYLARRTGTIQARMVQAAVP